MQEFREFLKKFKTENGLSINKLAEILEISNGCLSKVYYGERNPSINFLRKLKKAYPSVDINAFFED